MGSFNTLNIDAPCVNCDRAFRHRIQFKFGVRRQFEYTVGDKIIRGDPYYEKGELGLAKAIVNGCLENEFCPYCRFENPEFCDIIIEHDIIKGIRPEADPGKFIDEEYYEA